MLSGFLMLFYGISLFFIGIVAGILLGFLVFVFLHREDHIFVIFLVFRKGILRILEAVEFLSPLESRSRTFAA